MSGNGLYMLICYYKLLTCLATVLYCVVQMSSFGDTTYLSSRQLRYPWSLLVDSQALIIASDCDNRCLLLLRFDDDKLVYLGLLVSQDVPESFYPRRLCVSGPGLVYVGSGRGVADSGVPAGTPGRTLGSVTVWNIHSCTSV